jgi:Ca-activated chloride channel family protein
VFQFASPAFLWLLLLVPLLGFLAFRRKREAAIKFSDITLLRGAKESPRARRRKWLPILRLVAVTFFILALARPQSGKKTTEVTSEGIDMMLVLDISSTMKSEDFKPQNRMYVAKEVIKEFVKGRQNDRIGLVIFAGQAFTQACC